MRWLRRLEAGDESAPPPTTSAADCEFMPHGIDGNGDRWDSCIVHHRLTAREACVCDGYVAPVEDPDENSV